MTTSKKKLIDIVSIGAYQLHLLDKEPMIPDLLLAERLEYANPYKIRELINRMLARGQIKEDQVFPILGKNNTGRPSTGYHLSEKACLKVITRSILINQTKSQMR